MIHRCSNYFNYYPCFDLFIFHLSINKDIITSVNVNKNKYIPNLLCFKSFDSYTILLILLLVIFNNFSDFVEFFSIISFILPLFSKFLVFFFEESLIELDFPGVVFAKIQLLFILDQ